MELESLAVYYGLAKTHCYETSKVFNGLPDTACSLCRVAMGRLGIIQGTVVLSFVLIPLAEPILPQSTKNIPEEDRASYLEDVLFDWLLYLNVPIVFGLLGLFIYRLNTGSFTQMEWFGWIASVGIVLGTCGINVAHELGHRPGKIEQALSLLLLWLYLYQHFFIEHNRGHHKYVATPDDPLRRAKASGCMLFGFDRCGNLGYTLGRWNRFA
ncbi:MAG: fatty acid desaturase [Saprospiraceae bacterium]